MGKEEALNNLREKLREALDPKNFDSEAERDIAKQYIGMMVERLGNEHYDREFHEMMQANFNRRD